MSDQETATERFERALRETDGERFALRLYVVGATPASQRAIANIRELCESELAGRFQLEVVDVYQQPTLAAGEQIVATPTLIKKLPPPVRRLVGDMSDHERVLLGLDIVRIEAR